MRFAIDLARRNVLEQSGGPFGAALFHRETGEFYAAGVNSVLPNRQSIAHAEMMAIIAGQAKAGREDLSGLNLELAISCEPCAMCYGALLWSGVKAIRYAATGAHAAEIGFDEGEKPGDWADACRRRGIQVTGPMLEDEGRAVLQEYVSRGGVIYNPER